jgi:nitroimidazol reductase NimA-like FMN-containing flavoprotein (pyridoxamine 5'-phosphate oxidase superfamily)
MNAPARSTAQRKADALARLQDDVDLWVASADETGSAYLIPLSYYWDGSTLTVSTPRESRTARNLTRAGWARVALGRTRDVLVIEGDVETIRIGADVDLEDAHARATGFDPRTLADEYVYLRITPREIQAWRESNELAGRRLMRAGDWLPDAAPAEEPKDPAASARAILAENRYMTLATADADGRPWASPVWYATEDNRSFYWVSSPQARHSQNLTARPEVAIVVFDSHARGGAGRSVYMSGAAEEVGGDELAAGIELFSRVSQAQDLPAWSLDHVGSSARHRLYRATVTEHYTLDSRDERQRVSI